MTLRSISDHYKHLSPVIQAAKESLRNPIEKRLNDEVKLSKWDEQSYYALSDSSKKSHQKLMMLIREYEVVLEKNVAEILEKSFSNGVRSHCAFGTLDPATKEPVTEIPPNSSMFPKIDTWQDKKLDVIDVIPTKFMNLRDCNRVFTIVDKEHNNFCDKNIFCIARYSKKMRVMLLSCLKSHAKNGADCATLICDAIFARITSLRSKTATKPMKQRALVDLFKCLRKQGYSSMKVSCPKQIRVMSYILQLPCPVVKFLSSEDCSTLESAESYFRRCNIEISRLRVEAAMLGSNYMTQREIQLMIGFSEHGLLMICQQRCNIASVIESMSVVNDIMRMYDRIHNELPSGQVHLFRMVKRFDAAFFSVQESLRQTLLLVKSIIRPDERNQDKLNSKIVTILNELSSVLSKIYCRTYPDCFITKERLSEIRLVDNYLQSSEKDIQSVSIQCQKLSSLPREIFDPLLKLLRTASAYAADCHPIQKEKIAVSNDAARCKVLSVVSTILDASRIAAQSMLRKSDSINSSHTELGCEDDHESNYEPLWKNHLSSLEEWSEINMNKILQLLIDLTYEVRNLAEHSFIQHIIVDMCSLLLQVVDQCQCRLRDYLFFYRNAAKLLYIKLRLFRVLIAKGFCSDDVDDGEGDLQGDSNNLTFEDDVEGTGMGGGEGKNDVTDQIETEEQLLGLQGDKEEKSEDQKQLGEDETDTGLEMEADFAGELFDVPDKRENEDELKEEGEDSEELEREMGDESDPNEQVVDEKMWDENDEIDENQPNNEKFERNSKVAGNTVDDELRTKEENDEDASREGKEHTEVGKQESTNEENNEENPPEGIINDDLEENYEDQNLGVEVRDEADDIDKEGKEEDCDMNLDDDINIEDDEEREISEAKELEQASMQVEEDDNTGEQDDVGNNIFDEEMQHEEEEGDDQSIQIGDQKDVIDDSNGNIEEGEEIQHPELSSVQDDVHNDAYGVAAKNGTDTIKHQEDEEDVEAGENACTFNKEDNQDGAAEEGGDEGTNGVGKNDSEGGLQSENLGLQTNTSSTMDVPNPFLDPGIAEEFWHKKLNMIENSTEEDEEKIEDNRVKNTEDFDCNDVNAVFEFTSKEQSSSQVLAAMNDEESPRLDVKEEASREEVQHLEEKNQKSRDTKALKKRKRNMTTQDGMDRTGEDEKKHDDEQVFDDEVESQNSAKSEQNKLPKYSDDPNLPESRVVTDLSQLHVQDCSDLNLPDDKIIELNDRIQISHQDLNEARVQWSKLQSETNSLSRRLCEKLRLVMEPLVATKLQGDYRSGKRINMRRVIGYIASSYRKDKIWLRRTKPAKRNYRVLLAVDNSESMKKGGAGTMALTAMATLANGMNQLEIGELGIASFGEEMKLLHQFNKPFTSGSGVELLSNFTFDDKRTRTALCVQCVLAALESQPDTNSSLQLVFIISDGRIERDNRFQLRKLVREMSEKNILLVMIIVEGERKDDLKSNDSIINMKEASFEDGKLRMKNFIEDYPFPYYIVLHELNTLPM